MACSAVAATTSPKLVVLVPDSPQNRCERCRCTAKSVAESQLEMGIKLRFMSGFTPVFLSPGCPVAASRKVQTYMPSRFRLMLLLGVFALFGTPTRAAVNILMVTQNNGTLTALESGRKSMLESNGFTINTIWDGASQATFNAAFANNRAVYLPDEATAADVGYKLRAATIGVFTEHPGLADELGLCSGTASTVASSTINVTNNTHYITNVFSTGNLSLSTVSASIVRMGGTTAPGGQVLATVGGNNSLVAVEAGATLANTYNSSNVAFGRRAQFPLPVSANNSSAFTSNVYTLAIRILRWVAGLDRTLVGHWKLNETSGTSTADSSGLSTSGTVTGTAAWTAAVLNNGFQFNGATRIQVTGMFSNPRNTSVAAWANLTTADSGGSEIISLGDHFYLRLDEGGVVKAVMYTGSAWQSVTYSATYAGTGWHHFAATFDDDNNSFRLYVDGKLVASATNSNSISYAGHASNTVIGRHGNSSTSNDFTGTIDDVRVYNYAISATEVAQLFGLIGHWKLAETSGASAVDSTVFARNPVLNGAAAWSTDCGGMGVFNFNGSSHYFSVANAADFQPTGMLSIAAWIKADAFGTGTDVDTIVRKGDSGPNNYALVIADGRVELLLDATGGSGIRGNTVLTAGQWYHVAATWDGATARIYVNGVLDNSPGTARGGSIATDTRPLYLGGRPSANYFDGMIRDVRLLNRPLTSAELLEAAGLVGHWKFAEGAGTNAADSSGLGHPAILSGGASWTSDCAGNNNALLTNGIGGIAQTSVALDPPSVGTVAFWMRSTGRPAATTRIMGLGGDWEVRQNPDGRVISDLSGDGDTTIGTVTPLAEVGRWYHFAATFDTATKAYVIYVDGKAELSGTNANAMSKQAAALLSFGTRTGSSEYWNGALRDVRVYNRKLCPVEVAELYGLVGHWKFDETSGSVAADSSGLNRTGTVVGTASWSTGKLDNAIQLNGSTRVEVNGVMGSPRNVTLAGWANLTAADSGGSELISIGDCFAIRINEGSNTRAFFYNGSSWVSAGVSQTFVGAGWHHFAAVFNDDQNYCKLYIDGVEVASTSTTVTIPWTGLGTKTVIGAHGNGQSTYDFTGKVDDMRVYNRALCPLEVLALKNGGGSFGGVRIIKWNEIQ